MSNSPADGSAVAQQSRPAESRWAAGELNLRSNGLNLIRLFLALAVIVHHAYPLGGFDGHPSIYGIQYGGWAVFGFFTLSGYLITATRTRNSLGTFLVHRVARIYPGFWVCLLVTAGVFAPIAQYARQSSLDGLLTTAVTPFDYLLQNFTLRIGSYSIGTTLADTPYPNAWNGSLWTLYYEFICYALIGAAFCFAWWRRHRWATPAAFVVTVVLFAHWSDLSPYFGGNIDLQYLLQLLPFFLAGSALYRYRTVVPLHWVGALISVGIIVAFLEISVDWGLQAAAPALTYLLLWLGQVIPAPAWIARNDVSYGVYIYAFPIQQLTAALGVVSLGLPWYLAISVVVTLILATASWYLVERPVIRRARGR